MQIPGPMPVLDVDYVVVRMSVVLYVLVLVVVKGMLVLVGVNW